jgi:hypothetical protein
MMILAQVVFPDNNIHPNLGALLIIFLNHQTHKALGTICGGGVITILARVLNINVIIYEYRKALAVLVLLLGMHVVWLER